MSCARRSARAALLGLLAVLSRTWALPAATADEPRVVRQVIDGDFPGAYQVEVADVNGDGKPDVVVVGGSTCAWFENPSWKKRIITTGGQSPGVISSATTDLDRDGKAEVAIAYDFEMNQPARGKLRLARQGSGPDDPWTLFPARDVPSIHRLRWGDVDGGGAPDLVVAPIFGLESKPPRFEGAGTIELLRNDGERDLSRWKSVPLLKSPVIHAIEVKPLPGLEGRSTVLAASNDGVSIVDSFLTDGTAITFVPRRLVDGSPGKAPKRGCSEVHLGRLAGDHPFLATLEPWHGGEVAVYPGREAKPGVREFGERTVIDSTLDDGHALWVADVDGDGDDEILAGHRGKDHRVSLYDYDRAAKTWKRSVLDREVAAQDLRGGDLDGDGTPDVVAAGGATHNVVWYRFVQPSAGAAGVK
ncbi:FG-GAP repeat domain-containing protein [Aquisphaera insulae]|uniref:FG-GAP repeat domain-containing protein n=1 Tax=Aquisphaera insulae TaxID=2712864 RepID=UPI0020301815|nr:VCBS repeat-containing protein [Aquisphaera insulae]